MSPKDLPLIEAFELEVETPGRTLFEGLSFSLGVGLAFITGDEGSGKSTLLAILDGARTPDSGSIRCHARDRYFANPNDPSAQLLTGHQWLQAQSRRFGRWDPALQTHWVERFALAEHVSKELWRMSTGTRRKLGWVAAIACGADLVMLDGPFSALDARSCALGVQVLRQMAQTTTSLWVVADYELPTALHDVALAGQIVLATPA
jgi:ABC-type multidrug transport system ATPase subunit